MIFVFFFDGINVSAAREWCGERGVENLIRANTTSLQALDPLVGVNRLCGADNGIQDLVTKCHNHF